jgi:hypothetical protein
VTRFWPFVKFPDAHHANSARGPQRLLHLEPSAHLHVVQGPLARRLADGGAPRELHDAQLLLDAVAPAEGLDGLHGAFTPHPLLEGLWGVRARARGEVHSAIGGRMRNKWRGV